MSTPRSILSLVSARVGLGLFALSLTSAAAIAGTVPYPSKGVIAPVTNLTAATSGEVIGTFVNYSAADSDYVTLFDVTSNTYGPQVFFNKSTIPGTSTNLGLVSAGDTFLFLLTNTRTGLTYSTDPALVSGADGKNHGYITDFAGGTISGGTTIFSAGTYVGLEDVFIPPSDLDYNDDAFVFNVQNSAVPEPNTFALLGTGALSIGAFLRRRVTA